MSADGGAALTDQKFGDRRQARADMRYQNRAGTRAARAVRNEPSAVPAHRGSGCDRKTRSA